MCKVCRTFFGVPYSLTDVAGYLLQKVFAGPVFGCGDDFDYNILSVFSMFALAVQTKNTCILWD